MTDREFTPYAEQERLIDAAVATFPEEFGMRAFPGKRFRISRGSSYWSDGYYMGEPKFPPGPHLYVYVEEDGDWLSFAKGTPTELRREIVPLPSGKGGLGAAGPDADKAAEAVWKWVAKNNLKGDALIYSSKGWADRGESMGKGSLFTIVTDGSPLYELTNEHFDHPLYHELERLQDKLGVYHELGYGWTMHFYPAS